MENNTISVNLNNLTEEEREQFFLLVEKSNSKKGKVWNPEKGIKFYNFQARTSRLPTRSVLLDFVQWLPLATRTPSKSIALGGDELLSFQV